MSSLKTLTEPRTKLTQDQKLFIAKMHGRMMSINEIIETFQKEHGVLLSWALVKRYKDAIKWTVTILKEKERYLAEMSAVPIFHPRVRFERYEKLYNMALDKGDMKGMHDALSLTQTEFGKKVGGDTYNQVFMTNNTVSMSMEEIRARKDKLLNRLHELNPEVSNEPDRKTEED